MKGGSRNVCKLILSETEDFLNKCQNRRSAQSKVKRPKEEERKITPLTVARKYSSLPVYLIYKIFQNPQHFSIKLVHGKLDNKFAGE